MLPSKSNTTHARISLSVTHPARTLLLPVSSPILTLARSIKVSLLHLLMTFSFFTLATFHSRATSQSLFFFFVIVLPTSFPLFCSIAAVAAVIKAGLHKNVFNMIKLRLLGGKLAIDLCICSWDVGSYYRITLFKVEPTTLNTCGDFRDALRLVVELLILYLHT